MKDAVVKTAIAVRRTTMQTAKIKNKEESKQYYRALAKAIEVNGIMTEQRLDVIGKWVDFTGKTFDDMSDQIRHLQARVTELEGGAEIVPMVSGKEQADKFHDDLMVDALKGEDT